MTSERSVNTTLTTGAYFYLAYVGNAWRALNDPAISSLQWSIVCFVDLRMRPDGFINTPPVASVVSPQYVVVNRTTQIPILVSDANTGDDVRCRWSTDTLGTLASTSSYVYPAATDECSGICYPASMPSGTTLSNCTLSFEGLVPNTWYGAAIQVSSDANLIKVSPLSYKTLNSSKYTFM
jgi:hypothetical protein